MTDPVDAPDATAPDGTLVDLLRRRAAETPDALAYAFLEDGRRESDRASYASLDADARRIAAGLLRRHAPGARALILLPQGVNVLRAFFGCLYAGLIPIPAPAPEASRRKRTLPRLQSIVRDAAVGLVVSEGDTLDLLREAQAHAPELAAAEMLDIAAGSEVGDEGWTQPDAAPDDIAYLQYSSGSTGSPKGVEITHRNALHQCAILRAAAGYGPQSVTLTWLPYFHDYGLVEGMLLPLQNGTPCWMLSPFAFLKRPVGWLEAMSRLKATHTQAPNFAWDQCLRRLRPGQVESMDLSHVVALGNAAEPINPEITDRFVEVFAAAGLRREAMCPAYGLAEATLIMTHSAPTEPPHAPGFDPAALTERRAVRSDSANARRIQSCGRPIGSVDVAIVDPDTRERLTAGRIGEIWLADPSIAAGYWGRPETTEETFRAFTLAGDGPFLRTGDLGFLHEGELYLSGRLKDLIIVAGQNHYPMDIEWTVEGAHDAIRPGHVAAAAMAGPGEERLLVAAEIERGLPDDDDARDALLRAVRAAVSETHEIPLHAFVMLRRGSIPKTASGKIQRHACAALAERPSAEVLAVWTSAGGWRAPATAVE